MVGDMGATILVIVGIFCGIGVFIATMYSMTQVLLLQGKGRIAHGLQFLIVMAIMTVLYIWRDAAMAQLIAVPLLPVAIWTFLLERRWYRIFPILIFLFALVLIAGYVALNPT